MILLRLPKLVWMGKVESYQVTLEKQLSISRSNSLLFRLAEDGIYALGKPHMRSSPFLRFVLIFVSQFPLKRFQCSSDWRWPSLVVSKKSVEHFLFPRLSTPGGRWCNVLGFVPAGGGSSSSTFQIFREAGHLWVLLWPPVYPLGRFPSLRYVETEDQGSRGPPTEQQNAKAVSARHCAVTTAPSNCCPNCYAEQSHKDNIRSSAVGKQLKQKSNSHFPALDLFWANFFLRVQLTSLLLISPGL